MQLILLLALLLLSGGSREDKDGNGLKELFQPETVELLKEISGGDGQVEAFINEVREISEAVAIIAPLAQSLKTDVGTNAQEVKENPVSAGNAADISEILKPVRNIADDGVYNALARAVRI